MTRVPMSDHAPPSLAELSPEAAVRRLDLLVTRRLDGLLQGRHLGALPGPGSEPAEVRAYQPGDDVRRIDWAVTARTQETSVRDAVAERELETWLAVDLSASMDFGTARCEKRDLAVAAAAAFGHLASGPGDRTGALVLQRGGLRRLPPRSGRAALLGLLRALVATPREPAGALGPAGRGLGLSDAIAALESPPRRRGLAVVVSDFLDLPGERAWERPLRRLAVRHQVVAVEVVDPRELALPAVGVLTLVDPETGRVTDVQTSSRRLRERYAAAAAAARADTASALARAGAAHLVLRTDEDWLAAVARFVDTQRRTRGSARGSAAGALATTGGVR